MSALPAYDPPPPRSGPSIATQQLREHVTALARATDPAVGVHLPLLLNALLRRIDELEDRIAELEARDG